MYHITRLSNGLTVATACMPHMASVSVGLWVNVGGRYEPAALNGVSHFIEHMLFKGTKRRSARDISQAVEGIGGYLNAYTSEEHTCFYSKARHDRFQELLDVLFDMFLNSRFDPLDIRKEREVIKEELAMYVDQPQQYVQELLNHLQWPGQPLGRSLTGTEKTLDAMNRQRILGYKTSYYVAPCILVAAAGNLSAKEIVESVSKMERLFADGPKPQFTNAHWKQEEPAIRLASKKTEQTQIALGIRTTSRHDERRFALRILNTVLGENMSSRLFQTIREDRGLAYSVYSCLSFFDDTGDLAISAGLEGDNVSRVLKLILKELLRLRTERLTAAELRRARDYVIGQMDLSLENTENQMMWLGEHVLGYGRIPCAAAIKDRLAKVTAAEIRQTAEDFFRPGHLNLAMVSPMKSSKSVENLLRKEAARLQ